MPKDFTERALRDALNRLEREIARREDVDPSEGGTSERNPGNMTGENIPLSAEEHAEAILSNMSTLQVARFIAIARDFDDTEPEPPDMPGAGDVNMKPFIPLSTYSKARVSGTGRNVSDTNAARLEVLTGGGEWIEVSAEDMAAARQIESEL